MDEQVDAPDLRYRAFISYSHIDEAAARRLHRRLETYRIPRRLVGTTAAFGAVPSRLSPIFRDREELPAASSLTIAVRQALGQSRGLLVLCSPSARTSNWVAAEVAYFRVHHPERPIIAALLGGEPAESFPAALLSPDAGEPIAADFRPGHDGVRLARLKILAGLTGLPLDALIQRDGQRQMRRVIYVTLASLVFGILMALLLVLAILARREAEQQRRQAEGLIEFMLTDLRTKLEGVGRLDVLGAVNDRALAYYGEQKDLSALPPGSLERRARVLHAMGEDELKRGAEADALAKFQEAHRVTNILLVIDPDDPDRIFAHAQSEFWIGYINYVRRRFDKAAPRFITYRNLARQLVGLRPDDMRYRRELGYAEGNLCTIAVHRKAVRDLSVCGSALATMERVAAAEPDDPQVRADLANRLGWMADAEHVRGRDGRALNIRRRQIAIVDALLATEPKNAGYREDWMLARLATAELLRAMDRPAETRYLLEECRRVADELIAADPENQVWRMWRDRINTAATGGKPS